VTGEWEDGGHRVVIQMAQGKRNIPASAGKETFIATKKDKRAGISSGQQSTRRTDRPEEEARSDPERKPGKVPIAGRQRTKSGGAP